MQFGRADSRFLKVLLERISWKSALEDQGAQEIWLFLMDDLPSEQEE